MNYETMWKTLKFFLEARKSDCLEEMANVKIPEISDSLWNRMNNVVEMLDIIKLIENINK